MSRRYSSISVQTTLATGVSNTALIIPLSVGTAAGLLGGVTLAGANADQFSIMMDPDTLGAEIMWVTGISGDNLTVLRGKDGTSAIAHSGGAVVKHILTSGDLIYFATGVVPTSNLSTGLPFPGATSGVNTLVAPAITGTVTNTLPATTGTLMSAESVDAAVSKVTPVGADEIPLSDSAASFGIKKLTLTNLAAWFASLTQVFTNKDLSSATNTFPANYDAGKNKILNGNFALDQRNSGAAQTLVAGTSAYTVDRWIGYCAGANVTGQRVAGSGNTRYRYQYTGAASVTAINHIQRIEQAASYELAGTTATLAVDLADSLLTSVAWTAYYANSADNFG